MTNLPPEDWLYQNPDKTAAGGQPDPEMHPELYPELDPDFFSNDATDHFNHRNGDDNIMTSITDSPQPSKSDVRGALAQLRKQLLDLTALNPLISYKHSTNGRYLRIIDEIPNNVAQQLYDGKILTFAPLPEPSKEEIEEWEKNGGTLIKKRPPIDKWAEKHEIPTSYDLPVGSQRSAPRHSDPKIQTLHYPDSLEARIGNLYKISRAMVEETGTNLLHLTFGFLEWQEANSSDKSHFAPLYNLPVGLEKGTINRKTNTYEYSLRIREDEVQFNASIATRLEDDFGFVLPKLDPEQLPEDYLLTVENAISASFPRWKVHRWGTLAMFNFSRLLMYRDLDPDNWPQGSSLDAHPLVTAVIQRSEREHSQDTDAVWGGSSPVEHPIDRVEGIYEKFPLVDVADSSQHSALIDAIEGKNLVIQGPPGTGKSQTITNLIAAALNSGKSVLFVSEKLAALDVVKSRLEKLGLGEFCLELHSHNTKKIGVVDSLKSRLEAQFKDTRLLESHVSRHRDLAKELNEHAERINRLWKQSGMTVLEILTRCVRYWNEIDQVWDDLRIKDLDGTTWTQERHADAFVEFDAYVDQLSRITSDLGEGQNLSLHPWRGIRATNLDGSRVNDIVGSLIEWENSLNALIESAESFPAEGALGLRIDLKKLEEISNEISIMPPASNEIHWKNLDAIWKTGIQELDTIASEVDKLAKATAKIGNITLNEVISSEELPILKKSISELLDTGISSKTQLEDLKEIHHSVSEFLKLTQKWQTRFEEFHEYSKGDTPSFLDIKSLSIDNLASLEKAIKMNRILSEDEAKYRNLNLLPHKLGKDGDTLREKIKELRKSRSDLEKIFDLERAQKDLDLNNLQETTKDPSLVKRLFHKNYREARKAIRAVMHNPKTNWDHETIPETLQILQTYFTKEQELKSDEKWQQTLKSAFSGLDTDLDRLDRLIRWHADLESQFPKNEGKLFNITDLSDSGKWILDTNQIQFGALQNFGEDALRNDLNQLKTLFSKIILAYDHKELPTGAKISNIEDEWRQVIDYLNAALPEIISRLTFQKDQSESLAQSSKRLETYGKIKEDWGQQSEKLQRINSQYFSSTLPCSPYPTSDLRNAVSNTRRWIEWLGRNNASHSLNAEVLDQASGDFVDRLRQWQKSIVSILPAQQAARDKFASLVNLDFTRWADENTLTTLRSRTIDAREAKESLHPYLTFLRLRGSLAKRGFEATCDQAEQSGISKETCKPIFEYLVTASLSDELFSEDDSLRQFDGVLLSKKLKEFRNCDQTLLNQTQIRTAARTSARRAPTGYRGTRVSEHTEMALILHETDKQKRHLPLRQLLKRAGKATQALKPCFMMGPRSIAQYLEPGAIEFDILVIDEASQMRPADAIGAIARCKQLVVVGDSKQLAPSSFFDRAISSGEEEDEQFEAAVAESLLDAVSPVFSRRQLRWHYRSKHPSLIAFSNRQFYDNRLMLFPSPHFSGENLGIRFNYISEGIFENQVNTTEALRVSERARDLILANPSISLGIATMNAKQRDLVERILENETKSNEGFAEAWEKNRLNEEPLFIKNLENVQGDEREVMIISCTYGRPRPGVRVMQRFGPINSADGGRRLNVLFTRSRTRMEIFSSMQASDVEINEKSSDGVRALKGILRYAETGIIEESVVSGRDPDSDFEIAAAQMLMEHGYEVECQIGVAGFFIDIGVKHPSRPGEYILGVECDGAAFHSSKSARDRDRIRQDVLESMGWTIERIWSTDWFQDPHKAIRPVLDALSKAVKSATEPT